MDKWDRRFMEMAHLVSTWTSCFTEGRAIGAVIVKDKRVLATGYNGAPAGLKTCKERGECLRRKLGVSIDGGTLYCTHQPCSMCTRIIINAGIRRVVYEQGYPDDFSLELFHESATRLERYDPETGETKPC